MEPYDLINMQTINPGTEHTATVENIEKEAFILQRLCCECDSLINTVFAKIKEVQNVSNKTNLLAINASIETIHASDLLSSFEHIVTTHLYIQARIIALILESNPDFILQDGVKFASECGIDEFYITDKKGFVCFTNVQNCNNSCLKSSEMLKILGNPALEVALPASNNNFNNQLFKTIGISRKGKTGIIQLGTRFVRPNGQLAINGFGVVAKEAKRLADDSKEISIRITRLADELGADLSKVGKQSTAILDNTLKKIENCDNFKTSESQQFKYSDFLISIKEILSVLNTSLNEIKNNFNTISHPLKDLINIARQTNLLGVRAAIEAAHSTNDKQDFDDLLNKHMIIEAKLSSMLVAAIPNVSCQDITNFSNYTGIGEFWVTDEQGKVEVTNVPGGTGFVFKNEGQTAPYMRLLSDPDSIVTAPPSRRALDDRVFKYVGVGRKGKGGIFQIGSVSKLYGESTAEGFSVVATQIKDLSEQSRILTFEIETLIEEMGLKVSKAFEHVQFIQKLVL